MALGKAQAILPDVDWFSIVTVEDMLTALQLLQLVGFEGRIEIYTPPGESTSIFRVVVTKPVVNYPAQTAVLGQYLVYDGINVAVFSATEFAAHYTVTA